MTVSTDLLIILLLLLPHAICSLPKLRPLLLRCVVNHLLPSAPFVSRRAAQYANQLLVGGAEQLSRLVGMQLASGAISFRQSSSNKLVEGFDLVILGGRNSLVIFHAGLAQLDVTMQAE